jgi:hypothetical protein
VAVTSAVSREATIQADCKHSPPNYASGFRNATLCLFTGYWYGVACYTGPWTASDPLALPKEQPLLYGCETWPTTAGGEYRLGVFENRAMGKILWPKREEVMGDWRKLHNEELHDQYS